MIKFLQQIHILGPIDGSKEFLKYVWYYQRYQPKYQISNKRTILLSNITEKMQGWINKFRKEKKFQRLSIFY